MEPWIIGLIALVVVGLGVIVYGALHDRARNRRRAAEMLAPPPRMIPQFKADSPAPHYLSELQARRPPPEAEPTDLTPSQREAITRSALRSGHHHDPCRLRLEGFRHRPILGLGGPGIPAGPRLRRSGDQHA